MGTKTPLLPHVWMQEFGRGGRVIGNVLGVLKQVTYQYVQKNRGACTPPCTPTLDPALGWVLQYSQSLDAGNTRGFRSIVQY